MAKKMLIDATHAEETRVVVVDGNKVEEFDFESENKRQLAGNIYLAKVTRVEPSLQAAFVDYGGNRHGFLAFSEIHPDYYQIPVADREALMEEERAYAEAMKAREEAEEEKPRRSRRSRSRTRARAEEVRSGDAVETREVSAEISGMETIDLDQDDRGDDRASDAAEGAAASEDAAAPEAVTREGTGTGSETGAETASGTSGTGDASEAGQGDGGDAVSAGTDTQEEVPAQEDAGDGADASAAEAPEDEVSAPEDEDGTARDAAARDDSIESVADEDDSEDIRPVRKPRPRRYKIQEVIKVRQIMLVQVVKEERGNKGAALTTYLSLAGRYCVLMPNTARGGGISRKITNAADRKKLKEIAAEIDVPQGAGLIIRTAGAKRTKAEIKRDYEYLQRLWEQIRELTLKSIAPAKIYEEGDLIKRSIRDLYSREIDEVLVEGERGYRIAKDFMKMIMPSHAKNVKKYEDPLPLFARYQVESYLAGMFNPVVQLKSGGYIVIGVTEALVAIDVNSGRATKEGSIEETALKTNLEAAEEVARQLRLRDLAGLIVIDFIDMEERKNNAAVEKRLKEKLKTDRARIQVGRISGFGLLEMSRQRLRPGMIEATTQPCPACHGTGLIRSDDSMALSILRQIEEEGTRRRSREVLVRCPVTIANYLMNQKREHILQIESRYGMAVRVEGDMHLVSPDFTLEKFKTATRMVPAATAPVVSVDTSIMDQVDSDAAPEEPSEAVAAEATAEGAESKPRRKRRRRRRRGGSGRSSETQEQVATAENAEGAADAPGADEPAVEDAAAGPAATEAAAPQAEAEPAEAGGTPDTSGEDTGTVDDAAAEAAEPAESKPAPRKRRASSRSRTRTRKVETTEKASPSPVAPEAGADDVDAQAATETEDAETGATETGATEVGADAVEAAPAETEEKPRPRRSRSTRSRSRRSKADEAVAEVSDAQPESGAAPATAEEGASAESAPAEPSSEPASPAEPVVAPVAAESGSGVEAVNGAETAVAAPAEADAVATPAPVADRPAETGPEAGAETAAAAPEAVAAPTDEAEEAGQKTPPRPKRRGWWAMRR